MLVSEDCGLALTVCTSQEQAGLGSRRTHHDPALGAAISGYGRRVLDEFEIQDVDEESYRCVVVMNHNRHKLKERHGYSDLTDAFD